MISMASSSVKQGSGYAYKFSTTPPEYLFCPLCQLVARDPQLSVCCGTNFCKRCLETRAEERGACPVCKETHIALTVFPNKMSDREIKKLVVLCLNEEAGCGWRNELEKVEDHLTTCEMHYVECSQKCGATMKRQKLDDHLENECPHRPATCEYCYMTGEYHVIMGKHMDQCPKVPLCCPNECGVTDITRSEMDEHLKRCPLQKTICKYSDIGCKAMLTGQDEDEHDTTCMKEHFLLMSKELVHTKEELTNANLRVTRAEQMTERVRDQLALTKEELKDAKLKATKAEQNTAKAMDELSLTKEELITAKVKINKAEQNVEQMRQEFDSRWRKIQEEFYQWKEVSCTTFCGILPSLDWRTKLVVSDMVLTHSNIVAPAIVKVTDVSQLRKNDKTFQSPIFFSHYFGYRVCLLVIPNGVDQYKGYVSVGICVMSGPNDRKLSWPPRGKFTITLLNQVKNNNHHFLTLDASSGKISNTEMYNAVMGYVCKEFISHMQLLRTSPACTYSINDMIYLQVQYSEKE